MFGGPNTNNRTNSNYCCPQSICPTWLTIGHCSWCLLTNRCQAAYKCSQVSYKNSHSCYFKFQATEEWCVKLWNRSENFIDKYFLKVPRTHMKGAGNLWYSTNCGTETRHTYNQWNCPYIPCRNKQHIYSCISINHEMLHLIIVRTREKWKKGIKNYHKLEGTPPYCLVLTPYIIKAIGAGI